MGEVADERDVHAADEADLAGLGRHGRGHADEERALVLLEDDRLHVGQVDHRIDDREIHLRVLGTHRFEWGRVLVADHDDDGGAAPHHAAHGLIALGFLGHLELEIVDAGLGLKRSAPL